LLTTSAQFLAPSIPVTMRIFIPCSFLMVG
jgi:hypothetical protein